MHHKVVPSFINGEVSVFKWNFLILQVGDLIEAIDDLYGGWFEGKIVDIVRNTEPLSDSVSELAGEKEESEKSEEEKQSAKRYNEDPCLQDDGLLYMINFDL